MRQISNTLVFKARKAGRAETVNVLARKVARKGWYEYICMCYTVYTRWVQAYSYRHVS
jgi:hypothetical protein